MSSNDILHFYDAGAEIGRLERGLGKIEFHRTKEIISKYTQSMDNLVIYDIGGGIGVYSRWLAKLNHEVHLLELAPKAVEYAIRNQGENDTFIAEVADARNIKRVNESADIVLLMGPLYHLITLEDRLLALKEAYRLLKKDGLLFVSGISKYSTTTWALSTYGTTNHFLEDDIFRQMISEELLTGIHERPPSYPNFLTTAYFHSPSQLVSEIAQIGFNVIQRHAVEGIIWSTPSLNDKWEDPECRKILLDIVRLTETDEEVMGMSPHFMVVAQK